MPFPRYCTQSHASREHELEEDGQVISFAVHIHVKPESTARGGGSPRGQQTSGSGNMLLGRTAVALAAQAAGEDDAKPRPSSPSSTCSPASPSSTCSLASPSSACSSTAAAPGLGGRELQLRLVRSSFQPLGLRLAVVEEPEAWEIMSLEPGLVQHWNRENPQQQLLPGDLIMSINGEDTTDGMECAMAADPTLEMRVWRPARASRKISL